MLGENMLPPFPEITYVFSATEIFVMHGGDADDDQMFFEGGKKNTPSSLSAASLVISLKT